MKINFLKFLLILLTVVSLNGCALMLPDRSFIEQMERESDPFYAPGKDFPVVSGDEGEQFRSREEINARTPSSARSSRLTRESASLKDELRQKEEDLDVYDSEKYLKNRKYLISDSDKLYYLSLSSNEQAAYISSVKVDIKLEQAQKSNMVSIRSIHATEIFIGMAKTDVVDAWGRPAKIEIAGNPSNQNERWSFVEDGSVKQVYFEAGKVQGWALDL